MMLQRLRDARCRSCWEAFGGLLGPSDASQDPFGTSRGPLGDLLGASWEPLGSSWGSPWGVLDHLGCLLGRWEGPEGLILAILGLSWEPLGPLGVLLGSLGGLLEAFREPLGSILDTS